LKLVYVNTVVEAMAAAIVDPPDHSPIIIPYSAEMRVSELLKRLSNYQEVYLKENIIPEMQGDFEIALFNTFRSYLDPPAFQRSLEVHGDERGSLYEVMKGGTSGQFFVSSTKPGITRGNHYHRRKIERFSVIQGSASIQLRKIGTSSILRYTISGEVPSVVDIPVFYTHNITNIGDSDLMTVFWTNEIFDSGDPDTYPENV
jgi:UDP-2-acetamido-2,6-beta-L-arabino-hexul-4-ose reductase